MIKLYYKQGGTSPPETEPKMKILALVNKFPGKCAKAECGTAILKGDGFAFKQGDASWQTFCFDHLPETHGAVNPWKGQHRRRSNAAYGNSAWEARAIDSEYANTDYYANRCECGDIRWWKATVLATICPSCGSMKDNAGRTYETEAHVHLNTI